MRKDEQFFADESRMGREDKPKVISGEADLELASQKFEADKQAKIARNKEKLNKKGASGYTGGKGLRDEEETAIADNSDKNKISKEFAWWKERRGVIKLKPNDIMEEPEIEQEEIVQAEPEGNNLEKLKKEESELSEKLQQLPKNNPREPLSEEKKEIIAKLEQNREMQDIMAETKQTQTGSEEAIEEGGIKTDSLENIKDIKREESPVKQGKQPKVFQQQHLTDEYLNELKEEQRIEKENKEINDLRERIKEMPEIAEITKDGKKGVEKENIELKIENAQLKEVMRGVNEQLFAIEDKIRDKIIEISVEEDKEKAHKTITAIKKFLSKPKVKLAITVGLMGAAYTAGGGAPVILALKPLLAKIGIGYIPYAYGISSWGGGAIAGASGRWFAEKIGLVKNKKDARNTIKEFAMDLKGAANNENIKSEKNNSAQAGETEKPVDNTGEIDVAKVVELVQEAKKKGTTAQELLEGFNNDIKLIDGTIEAIKHEMSIFAFSKKKRDINAAHKWLREKRDEIKKLKLAENAVKSANESSEPVKIGVGSKVFTRNTDGNLEELILGKEITGEPEKPEEKEASQEDIKKYQKDRVGEFDAFYSEAANNKFDGEKIYKFFKKLDNLEKKEKGSEVTTLIRNEIDEKYDKAIVEKMKAAAVEYEKGQGAKKEIAGEGADENKEKLSEAKDKFFSLARLIGNNKEKINTNILETLAELVNNEIEKGNYETVAPIVELAKDLVKNKEKFEFFDKAIITYNRDNIEKKKLVSEIKTHGLHMENDGLLGATAKEKEKNRLAIAALLDSREFRNKI